MKIPVKISPFFFVTAALIGWVSTKNTSSPLLFTLIWMGVIFISILIHEYGHAITSYYFGQRPSIELVVFGGATYPEGRPLQGWKEFLVILNGPLFGFFLFLLSFFLSSFSFFQNPYLLYTLKIFAGINLFWTFINLLPIIPLDGGHLLRVELERIFGVKGIRGAFFIGMIVAFTLGIFSFYRGHFIFGPLFFFFAFQNVEGFRKSKVLAESDRNEEIAVKLKEAEELLSLSQTEEAIAKLEEIRTKASRGMAHDLATELLAMLRGEEKNDRVVYELLLSIKKNLSPKSTFLLHRAAHALADYPLVIELGGECFQSFPEPEVALRNAEACAALYQVEPAVGWLKAAQRVGAIELKPILSKAVFDQVRESDAFKGHF